jgi:hypothetical protein
MLSPAQRAIEAKYAETERLPIEEFVRHHWSEDTVRMAELALTLSHFRSYSQCVNAFIEQIQLTSFRSKNPFEDIVPLGKANWATIGALLPAPGQVMAKFVLNICHVKLKEHIQERLQESKEAFRRCQVLSKACDLPANAAEEMISQFNPSIDGKDIPLNEVPGIAHEFSKFQSDVIENEFFNNVHNLDGRADLKPKQDSSYMSEFSAPTQH